MPTNPQWAEHTEKAAWDTVKTLRDEIVAERKRLERFTKLHAALPKLSARLERAAAEHDLTAQDDVALLDQLCEKLAAAVAECERLAQLAIERPLAPGPALAAEDNRRWTPSVRWFASLIERRREGRSDPVDPSRQSRILDALELRVEELPSVKKRDLLEACVEIACLALDLARIARRAKAG